MNNSNVTNIFTKLTLQEASVNTVAQMNEELNRTEFDGACCKKLLLDRFFSCFR